MAAVAGDLVVLPATADGAAGGGSIVLSSLNGRETNADLGKWAVCEVAAGDVRFGNITHSEGAPTNVNYTLTIEPPLGTTVLAGKEIEIMAYPPHFYTAGILGGSAESFPYLYEPVYATISNLDPATYRYDLPAGVEPSMITRVMMSGDLNTQFQDVPYYEVQDYSFLPLGTLGAYQIVLNRLGSPFQVGPQTGLKLILMGWKQLTAVTSDGLAAATPMYRIQDDTSVTLCPQLTAGSQEDRLLREFALAFLFRTLMSSPATPDRASFAQAFQSQLAYALQIAPTKMMMRPEQRRWM